MTIYYVDSTATGGSNTGGSWANAFLTFAQAVTAATTANDLIYVSHAHSESLSGDTTYTFGADVRVLCVNSGTGALATTGAIGVQSTNYIIIIAGAYDLYFYGIKLACGTGSTTKGVYWTGTDGQHVEYEQCRFECGSGSGQTITAASSAGVATNGFCQLNQCVFKFGHAGQRINVNHPTIMMDDCSIDAAGTAVNTLLFATSNGGNITATGCDFSHLSGSGTLVGDAAGSGCRSFVFSNCKVPAALYAAQTTVLSKANTSAWFFNCASGDTHYALAYYDPFGETTVSATVYANDGASYDGSNRCSWKIITTANCSYYAPYVSPWMDVYHSGTSAITPYLEILRSGSTTKYQDDEVWSEWSYQGTSGSTKATIVNDRMTPLGTAADQTASSLGASDWTGEDATNNAYMKLESGSITPAEIGHIRACVCVGEPSITVYVDPQIRATDITSGINRVIPTGWLQQPAASGASPRFGDRTGGLR